MSDYEETLKEDKNWYKEFQNIKVPDKVCDICRTNKAERWFGLTSVILCSNVKCFQEQQRLYDEWRPDNSWEDE